MKPWWQAWGERRRFEREMQEEMRLHIEERAAELRSSGSSRRGALRQARLEFGRVEKFQEECRETSGYRLGDWLRQDIAYALRQVRREPLLALTVILTLGAGLGLSAGLFGLASAVALRPPVEGQGGQFARVYSSYSGQQLNELDPMVNTWRDYQAYAANGAFSKLAAWSLGNRAHVDGETASDLNSAAFVSCNFFQVYGLATPVAGRLLTQADCSQQRMVVVIADTLARQELGSDRGAPGRTLRFHGKALTVVGIVATPFAGQLDQIGTGAWIPVSVQAVVTGQAAGPARLDHPEYGLDGRLRAGVSTTAASAALRAIAARQDRLQPELGRHWLVQVTNGSLIETPGVERVALIGLSLVVLLVTLVALIAAANIAGVLLARAHRRRYEMAVRLSLGAGRMRLLAMLLSEVALLAALGGGVAAGLAAAVPRAIAAFFSSAGHPFTLHSLVPDGRVLIYLAAMTVLAAIIAGASPALEALRLNLLSTLKGRREVLGAGEFQRHWLRHWLSSGQVALSLVLIILACCFTQAARGVVARVRESHGYAASAVLAPQIEFRTPPLLAGSPTDRTKALENAIRDLPGVQDVAFSQFLPPAVGWRMLRVGTSLQAVKSNSISPGYLATLGIPLVGGRGFTAMDSSCRGPICTAVVSQEFLRRYPGPQSIGLGSILDGLRGRTDEAATLRLQIVGIAANTTDLLSGEPEAMIYQPWDPNLTGYRLLIRSRGAAASVTTSVLAVLHRNYPDAVISSPTLQEWAEARAQLVVRGRLGQIRALLLVLGLTAMGLTMLGLYGTFACLLNRRTKEMGVRIAFGAQRHDIYRLAARSGARPLGSGLAGGMVLYILVAVALQRLTTGPGGLLIYFWQPVVLAAGTTLVLMTVAAAIWLPARRATRTDPVAALREE